MPEGVFGVFRIVVKTLLLEQNIETFVTDAQIVHQTLSVLILGYS